MGFMSYIENEEYEKFKADGTVNISRFYLQQSRSSARLEHYRIIPCIFTQVC